MRTRRSSLFRILGTSLLIAAPLSAARESEPNAHALFTALHEGSAARVFALLEAGGDPNAVDEKGMTALMRAVVECDASVVRLLLDKGANPNATGTNGATPLVLAAGDLAKVKALVEKGADVNARSAMGRTALHAAAPQRNSYEVVRYLVSKGADVNARDNAPEFLSRGTGATPLMLAMHSMDNRTVKFLLDQKADVDAATTAGSTALVDAIAARNEEAVKMLLDRGAAVNFVFGPSKQTPLIWAAFQECPTVVQLLLRSGADVNAKDALGSTALVWASMSERDDAATVAALLDANAAAGVTTAMNERPLTWAKRRGNTQIVRLLENRLKKEGASNDRQ